MAGTAGGGRGATRVGALLGVLVLLLVLGALGWIAWQTFGVQPQRSIAQLGHAYTSHDWETFEPFVDVEAVVDAGVEQLLPEELRGEGLLGLLAEGLAERQKPVLVRQAREGMKRAVETVPDNDSWLRRQRGYLAPLRSDVLERSEDQARVRIDTGTRWGEVEVRMQRRGERWVVVEVLNLPELLARAGVRR